jgi:transcriptional activator of cad operon
MASDDRLESWKDIAAYLRRDVRTVQRWEQTDGLPVHRHKRAHRPIPYAYKSEIDAWWTSRSDVSPSLPAEDAAAERRARPSAGRYAALGAASLVAIGLVAAAYFTISRERARAADSRPAAGATASSPPIGDPVLQKSIAVLPFLDLTEGMKEEEFADGMTEELIDRLNKVRGLRVPAPTSSYFYKNKKVPVSEIGRTLHVGYVLDGSVRKSGKRLRVAARLIRADNADVVWSETYDRPWTDMLVVQDEIAGEVTKALTASLDGRAERGQS